MASKKEKEILSKIKIVITQHFDSHENAFNFFDKNSDGELDKKEIKSLLKEAKVSGFIRGLVANKLIEKFDESDNESIAWTEFKEAVKDIV